MLGVVPFPPDRISLRLNSFWSLAAPSSKAFIVLPDSPQKMACRQRSAAFLPMLSPQYHVVERFSGNRCSYSQVLRRNSLVQLPFLLRHSSTRLSPHHYHFRMQAVQPGGREDGNLDLAGEGDSGFSQYLAGGKISSIATAYV